MRCCRMGSRSSTEGDGMAGKLAGRAAVGLAIRMQHIATCSAKLKATAVERCGLRQDSGQPGKL